MYFWYNLFSDLKFVKGLFDTLISNINRVVVTFENTSQEFYFYMKILHTRPDFEKPEQKCVNLTYLVGIRNKTVAISKHSTKCSFTKNGSNKPFVLPGNFDI